MRRFSRLTLPSWTVSSQLLLSIIAPAEISIPLTRLEILVRRTGAESGAAGALAAGVIAAFMGQVASRAKPRKQRSLLTHLRRKPQIRRLLPLTRCQTAKIEVRPARAGLRPFARLRSATGRVDSKAAEFPHWHWNQQRKAWQGEEPRSPRRTCRKRVGVKPLVEFRADLAARVRALFLALGERSNCVILV